MRLIFLLLFSFACEAQNLSNLNSSPLNWPAATTLGDIYNVQSWTDLSDFTANGTSGASVVSNKIRFTGGSASGTNGLFILNKVSLLEKLEYEEIFTVVSAISSTTAGRAFSFHSINTGFSNTQKHTIYCRWNGTNDVTVGGTVRLLYTADQSTFNLIGASAKLTFAQNDRIKFTVVRDRFTYTLTAENLTNPNTVSYTYTFDAASTYTFSNTYKYLVQNPGAGTYDLESIILTSDETVNADVLYCGDSKTGGKLANVYTARFSNLSASDYGDIVVLGGPSDRTVEIVQVIDLITELNPRQIVFSVGRNDLADGVASGTWQANEDLLYYTFAAKGIQVIMMVIDEVAQNQSTLVTYLGTTKSYRFFHATGITLAADNIHPNATGHGQIHTQLVASGHIN